MVSKSRAGVLYETGKEFIRQYNDNKGIITATVVSATALTADAETKMIEAVIAATGKQVILVKKVDADLIGGFVLTVGDKQFDTSIAKSLVLLKKEFNS
jgi:F-type H+-transporting ATPase subunit delta